MSKLQSPQVIGGYVYKVVYIEGLTEVLILPRKGFRKSGTYVVDGYVKGAGGGSICQGDIENESTRLEPRLLVGREYPTHQQVNSMFPVHVTGPMFEGECAFRSMDNGTLSEGFHEGIHASLHACKGPKFGSQALVAARIAPSFDPNNNVSQQGYL